MNKDLVAIFEYLEREKGIKRETIIQAIEEALIVAARKSVSGAGMIDVTIHPKTGDLDVVARKEVVDAISYPDEEILLEEAREIDPTCQLEDWVSIPVIPEDFGRIAAQTARQVIAQKLRVAERDVIHEEYRHRTHEIVSGTVKRIIKGSTLIVDLGKVEGIVPYRFYPKTEKYYVGDRIQALLFEVRDTDNGGAEVVLSRSHPEFVIKLFEQEVPELNDGTVEVKKIVREAGYRTKLTVSSHDPKVDPLGACVGVRGTRVKNVIRELNNEKIDIVIDQENPIELLKSLLHPIEPKKWIYDENHITLIVNDEDYPIVIGKRGMNAQLNSKLIGMDIAVKKETDYQSGLAFEQRQIREESDESLDVEISEIDGVNSFIIDTLKEANFDTPRKILQSSAEHLSKATGISKEMAADIIEKVRKIRT